MLNIAKIILLPKFSIFTVRRLRTHHSTLIRSLGILNVIILFPLDILHPLVLCHVSDRPTKLCLLHVVLHVLLHVLLHVVLHVVLHVLLHVVLHVVLHMLCTSVLAVAMPVVP